MLHLVSYAPAFGEPSPSPFCVKAMCLLQMSGVEWQPKWQQDPRKEPKAKLPVLEDGDSKIADSHFILRHLESAHGADFDAGLSEEQKAISMAAVRMTEEHLYWAILHDRWMDDRNWAVVRDLFFSGIPAIMRGFVTGQVRRQVRGSLNAHGLGRHSAAEIAELATEDLRSLEGLLGDKPFMMGDAPTGLDATAGPFIAAAAGTPNETGLTRALAAMPKLNAYTGRVRDAIYPNV